MKRGVRAAAAFAVAALLATRSVVAQTFTTDLKGLGGTPVGLTPLNEPGASVMQVQYLNSIDPEARLRCRVAACCPCACLRVPKPALTLLTCAVSAAYEQAVCNGASAAPSGTSRA